MQAGRVCKRTCAAAPFQGLAWLKARAEVFSCHTLQQGIQTQQAGHRQVSRLCTGAAGGWTTPQRSGAAAPAPATPPERVALLGVQASPDIGIRRQEARQRRPLLLAIAVLIGPQRGVQVARFSWHIEVAHNQELGGRRAGGGQEGSQRRHGLQHARRRMPAACTCRLLSSPNKTQTRPQPPGPRPPSAPALGAPLLPARRTWPSMLPGSAA